MGERFQSIKKIFGKNDSGAHVQPETQGDNLRGLNRPYSSGFLNPWGDSIRDMHARRALWLTPGVIRGEVRIMQETSKGTIYFDYNSETGETPIEHFIPKDSPNQ